VIDVLMSIAAWRLCGAASFTTIVSVENIAQALVVGSPGVTADNTMLCMNTDFVSIWRRVIRLKFKMLGMENPGIITNCISSDAVFRESVRNFSTVSPFIHG
jgi:hypothetical protein